MQRELKASGLSDEEILAKTLLLQKVSIFSLDMKGTPDGSLIPLPGQRNVLQLIFAH